MKKLLKVLPFLLIAGGAWFLYDRYRIAPDITEQGVSFYADGEVATLADYTGENLIIVFYAKWCGQCMGEMVPLEQAKAFLADSNFRILALTDDTEADVKLVRDRFGITFETLRLEKKLQDHGIYTIPTAYVLNESGEVVFEHVGVIDWTDKAFLDELIAKVN